MTVVMTHPTGGHHAWLCHEFKYDLCNCKLCNHHLVLVICLSYKIRFLLRLLLLLMMMMMTLEC